MNDLVTWLRAQLDEDEMRAAGASKGPWHWESGNGYPQRISNPTATIVAETYTNPDHPAYDAEFIAWNHPARVLRDVEAKRRILDLTRFDAQFPDSDGGYDSACEDVIKLLATVFRDRPGYRDEWRP